MSGDVGRLGGLDRSVRPEQDKEEVSPEQKPGSGVAQVVGRHPHVPWSSRDSEQWATQGGNGRNEQTKEEGPVSHHKRRELQIQKREKLEWAFVLDQNTGVTS